MNDHGTTVANYSASGAIIIGGIALQHWVAIIGITLAVITFVVDMRDKRIRRQHVVERKQAQDELDELDRRIKTAQARREEAQLEALRRDG